MARKLTYEEVKNFIEVESGSGCKLLSEEYVNNSSKMIFKCKCGEEFEASFANFRNKNKRQCNVCGKRTRIIARRKTNKDFIEEIFTLVGSEYEFLEDYINSQTKIKCRHNECGHEYHVKPSNFLSGRRCPECAGNIKKNNEQFKKEVYDLVGSEYEFLEKYNNANTKIRCRHNDCGHEWSTTPNIFINQGTRCPRCVGNIKKTNEEFSDEVYLLVGDEYVFLEEYVNTATKIKCRHNKCNHEWNTTPHKFLQGKGCPQCNESKGEERIRLHLSNINIKYKTEYSFDNLLGIGGQPLRFDFAIFNYTDNLELLIEYDGEFHYNNVYENGSFETLQIHDKCKNQYCKDNNIPLLRIPYWDFDNIEEILEEWLKNHGMCKANRCSVGGNTT